MKIIPVIMAGGAGTRLWPLSRNDMPKQFHNFSGKGTLLEETIKRVVPLKPEEIVIVTSINYSEQSQSEIDRSGLEGTVLSEPFPRNTAAAVLYSSIYLEKIYKDSVMIILPADHYIRDNDKFVSILRSAAEEAEKDNLVTIGIEPAYPETGYGYIKAKDKISDAAYEVDKFVEKPDIKTAEGYLKSGNYFWNSGIFIWKVSAILDTFEKMMPKHMKAFEPLRNLEPEEIASNDSKSIKIKETIFNTIDSISIDYGIMEKAESKVVIPGSFGWSDLGSWKSIDDILPPVKDNNRSPDLRNAVFVNSHNCSAFSEGHRISIVGLNNVTVVQAGKDILVINKDSSQDVRKVVDIIKKEQ
ncbi:mannose-1-phosphate guanylyltransferase [Spirochaetota bacterium]